MTRKREHFVCKLRALRSDGSLFVEYKDYRFMTSDIQAYVERTKKRYEAKGYKAEFENIVNIDKKQEVIQ